MNVVDASPNDFLAVLSEPQTEGGLAENGIAILEAGRSLPGHKWKRLAAYAQSMSEAPAETV